MANRKADGTTYFVNQFDFLLFNFFLTRFLLMNIVNAIIKRDSIIYTAFVLSLSLLSCMDVT